MTGNQHFDKLVDAGKPVGEVIGVEKFIVKVKGIQPCRVHSLVMFDDGSKGFVHQVLKSYVVVLHLGEIELKLGMIAVLQHDELVSKVGKDFIGRVVDVTGKPLDGKGPIAADAVWPVFKPAPALYERKLLDTQLETGVTALDALFPVVRGQRMAMLGDSKSGKSTLATQMVINQKNTDQVVVYCMIAKRRTDIDTLLSRLEEAGSLEKAIVVVSTMFESLIMSYIAPYVACAMAEYLWQDLGQDTIIIYDDLTSHAQAYREVALLSGVSPGRDSYPGDMFYAHSSLLERAGRLDRNGAHLTSIPLVNAAGGDITAYLPTNIMSITDGQWILDMDIFRNGIRPAVNMGLSVTRVGGVGHNKRQKALAAQTLKMLADYRQSEEFSHFGSELAVEAKKALETGKRVFELLTQGPTDVYPFIAQQLMLDVVLNVEVGESLEVSQLMLNVNEIAATLHDDTDQSYETAKAELKKKSMTMLKGAPTPAKEDEDEKSKSSAEEPSEEKNDTDEKNDKESKKDKKDKK
jgi:F-type H+-transporting ATPase subunit alpha